MSRQRGCERPAAASFRAASERAESAWKQAPTDIPLPEQANLPIRISSLALYRLPLNHRPALAITAVNCRAAPGDSV